MWDSLWRVSNTLFNPLKQRGTWVLNHHLPRWTISCTRLFKALFYPRELTFHAAEDEVVEGSSVWQRKSRMQSTPQTSTVSVRISGALSWGDKSQILEDCSQIVTNSSGVHHFPGLISGTKIDLWWLSFLTMDQSHLLMLSGLMSVCRIPTFLEHPKPAKAAAVTTWIYFGFVQWV